MTYKDLLGGKGANLAEMTTVLNLPVPPGFTVSTDACRDYMKGGWPAGLDKEIAQHVSKLEKAMGRKLGDAHDPLLVSVRSGAKFSMPGMMDTVLNLGLNDPTSSIHCAGGWSYPVATTREEAAPLWLISLCMTLKRATRR